MRCLLEHTLFLGENNEDVLGTNVQQKFGNPTPLGNCLELFGYGEFYGMRPIALNMFFTF